MIKNILVNPATRRAIAPFALRGMMVRAVTSSKPLLAMPRRMMSSKEPVDPSTYIKEMEDSSKDWEAAMATTERPVLIQAGASWCGPCQVLKPLLLE